MEISLQFEDQLRDTILVMTEKEIGRGPSRRALPGPLGYYY
jgi:hypothetical protein